MKLQLLGVVGGQVYLPLLKFVVDRHIYQMGLPAPVLSGFQRGGGEYPLQPQLGFVRLHILHHRPQRSKAADFVHGLHGGLPVGEGKIPVGDGGIVNNAVALHHIGDAHYLVPVGDRQRLIGEMGVELGVLQIGAVVPPVGIAPGTVDLEQRRRLVGGHFCHEGLLIGVVGGGIDDDLDTGLLLIRRCQLLIFVGNLRLEVQIPDGDLVFGFPAAAGQRQQRQQQRRQRRAPTDKAFHYGFLLHFITNGLCNR